MIERAVSLTVERETALMRDTAARRPKAWGALAAKGVLARGASLRRDGPQIPMTRLEWRGTTVTRQDRWPTGADLGTIVILPGGEAGVLKSWWNAPDGGAWRWTVEFSNRRG